MFKPAHGSPRARSRILGSRLAGNRDFAKLWTAATISVLGSSVTRLALPTVAILQFHASVAAVGTLALLGWLPELLLSAVNGVIADRSQRRRLLIACDLVSGAAIGSIPVAVVVGQLSLLQLFVVQAVTAVSANLSDVAFFAFLPGLVGRASLPDANSRLESSIQTGVLVGPGLAGLLIQAMTAARAMSIDAVSFIASALVMGAIRRRGDSGGGTDGTPRAKFLADLRAGFHYVLGNPPLRRLAIASSLSNVGAATATTVEVVFAYRNAGLTPGGLGLALSIGALGAPVMALNAARITRRLGPSRTLAIAGLVNGAAFLLMPLALVFPAFVVFAASSAIFNLPNAVWNVSMSTLRQQLTADAMLGRMTATTMTVARGSLPVGAVAGGILGTAIGVVPTLIIGGLVAMSCVVPLLDKGLQRAALNPHGP